MKSSAVIYAAIAAIGLGASVSASATTSIDNTNPLDVFTSTGSFGDGATETVGQTLTTDGLGGSLNSFSFYLDPLSQSFQAYVYAWDAANLRVTGSALFSSGLLDRTTAPSGLQAVTVNTGGLALAANTDYALFFSTTGHEDAVSNFAHFGLTGDTFAGGNFIYSDNGTDFGLLSINNNWNSAPAYDMAFTANFAAPITPSVPEPETYAMLLGGLAIVGAIARRRKTT